MKKILVTVAALISLTAAAQKAGPVKEAYDFSAYLRKQISGESVTMPYRILMPENMSEGKKYPLFLVLHGMGLRGTDNERQLARGAYLFIQPENRAKYPCIALYPQAPRSSAFVETGYKQQASAERWSHMLDGNSTTTMALSDYGKLVMDVVDGLIDSGVVDTDRIYIAGSSMGAYSTYTFIAAYPDVFAAAAPMAGGLDLRTVDKWAGKVPIWIFHGSGDPGVPVEFSRRVVKRLDELGVTNYRYSEYPGMVHNIWDRCFAEPDFLEWFFSHAKEGSKTSSDE